jgi:anthranilate/para-aminobenzoate synthase component II
MGKVPVLGVCMGLECMVDLLGGDVSTPSLTVAYLDASSRLNTIVITV